MEITRTFDIVTLNCEKYPRKDMYGGLVDKSWKTYSTEEVRRNIDLVSMGLMALGLDKGDKVATITGNKPEWNFADMGMAQAGIIHVPIYPTITSEEYDYIFKHAEVKAVIVGNKLIYNKIKDIAEKNKNIRHIFSFDMVEGVRNFSEIIGEGERNESALRDKLESTRNAIRPEELVTIIYTSGTTGNSKGVMLSHSNLVINAIETSKAHEFGYGYRALSFLPLCHVYERMVNYHFQYKGLSIYYVENLGMITDAMKEIKPHIFNTVPRLLEKIYDTIIGKGKNLPYIKKQIFFWAVNLGMKYKLEGNSAFYRFKLGIARKLIFSKWREALGNEVRVMVSGGAALQSRLEKIFWAAGLPVLQGYGLTESSPVIAVNPFRMGEIRFGTVGPVLKDVEVKIAEDGEILARGPNIMMGYYKAPELTAEAIDSEGWLHTGDIGILEDGIFLKITDRKKEMFKLSAGKYIAPQPIENRLKESFFIEQAMVIGENEKVAAALISPNFTFLHDWCTLHKVQYRDNSELVKLPVVIERYSREVKEINNTLAEHEQIKKFRLVTDEWSSTTGELSPTLKLKRNVVSKKYSDIIAEIYDHNGKNGRK
ncbi:MAG: long-chain fatty acid--CoA ligase [Bacteroidales bacterium]|jgi:long-chain acyl-CoA synthetase|nr:long-chain fatty acid--CoA ligase [Bacteroidales bacterium]